MFGDSYHSISFSQSFIIINIIFLSWNLYDYGLLGTIKRLLWMLPRALAVFAQQALVAILHYAVSENSEDGVRWRVLYSMLVGWWVLLLTFYGTHYVCRIMRWSEGPLQWLLVVVVGLLATAITLFMVGGYGFEELEFAKQIPGVVWTYTVVAAQNAPRLYRMIKIDAMYKAGKGFGGLVDSDEL